MPTYFEVRKSNDVHAPWSISERVSESYYLSRGLLTNWHDADALVQYLNRLANTLMAPKGDNILHLYHREIEQWKQELKDQEKISETLRQELKNERLRCAVDGLMLPELAQTIQELQSELAAAYGACNVTQKANNELTKAIQALRCELAGLKGKACAENYANKRPEEERGQIDMGMRIQLLQRELAKQKQDVKAVIQERDTLNEERVKLERSRTALGTELSKCRDEAQKAIHERDAMQVDCAQRISQERDSLVNRTRRLEMNADYWKSAYDAHVEELQKLKSDPLHEELTALRLENADLRGRFTGFNFFRQYPELRALRQFKQTITSLCQVDGSSVNRGKGA